MAKFDNDSVTETANVNTNGHADHARIGTFGALTNTHVTVKDTTVNSIDLSISDIPSEKAIDTHKKSVDDLAKITPESSFATAAASDDASAFSSPN